MTPNRQRDELDVSTSHGHAGLLSHRTRTRYVFNYSKLAKSAISLVMPIRDESYASDELPSYFAMNLPEGKLLQTIRSRLQRSMSVDEMTLLALTGRNQIGRVTYGEPCALDEAARNLLNLDEILASPSRKQFAHLLASNFAAGVSRFQPKTLVSVSLGDFSTSSHTGESKALDLIVKSSDDDQPLLPQNEFLCMSAAKAAGLRVPDVWLAKDGGVLAIKRFDRDETTGSSVGFEDMATILQKQSSSRYTGSYEQVAQIIGTFCGQFRAESLHRFFEYVTFCVLIRNGDAHLKNFGLTYSAPENGDVALAPLFDVTTTAITDLGSPHDGTAPADTTLALKLNKSLEYPSRKSLLRFGRTVCGVAHPDRIVDRIAEAMTRTLLTHKHLVDERLLRAIEHHWGLGLASICRGFV